MCKSKRCRAHLKKKGGWSLQAFALQDKVIDITFFLENAGNSSFNFEAWISAREA